MKRRAFPKKSPVSKIGYLAFLMLVAVLFFVEPKSQLIVLAQDSLANVQNEYIDAKNTETYTRVAPGESLPIIVKLSNFGNSNRTDVIISYSVINSNNEEIYSTTETVAVETTASFVKKIPITLKTPPGTYTAKSFVIYQDQLVSAKTQLTFNVERKFFGFFQSDLLLYGEIIGAIFLLLIIIIFVTLLISARYQKSKLKPVLDYSTVPEEKRAFFELLSDTIMQMRGRVGNQALQIATQIEGLTIDKKTGRVLDISGNPAKIIASLVEKYDKELKEKVSFSFRRSNR